MLELLIINYKNLIFFCGLEYIKLHFYLKPLNHIQQKYYIV